MSDAQSRDRVESAHSSSRRQGHQDDARDREPSHRHKRSRRDDRDDGEDDDEDVHDKELPEGVARISEDDFFIKSNEFRVWLDEKKAKRLDSLKSSDARHYFSRFVRRWNSGRLSRKFYSGIQSSRISSQLNTTHNWSFKNASQRELDDASRIRKDIDKFDNRQDDQHLTRTDKVVVGPSLPSGSAVEALHVSRDAARDLRDQDRRRDREEYKRAKRDERQEERDNRATGRDRLIEKRKEKATSHREMRDAREAGGGMQEIDEDTLMGSGTSDSFRAAIEARDRSRNNSRRARAQEERQAEARDKISAMRAKENDTMAALRELAAARFGPSAPPS
ncbi:hypothetical protein OIV83_004678 [Microbotryomycetes sp. JL201]|nr:hypothetical protein OIV83_004678 [Microbotryomycetes sp. JL201]